MENSQALTLVPDSPLALMPVMTVAQAVERYKMMIDVVRDLLKEGRDFGAIPGAEKPTLLKPGAEKLCTFFGLQPIPVLLDSTEDWENGFFYYRYQCQLKRGNQIIAAAEGSANSREKKYRWRKIPEFKATNEEKLAAVKREELTSSKTGKPYVMLTIENSEPFDLVNTLQKMAQKRAMIASTLLAVNASEFFTQDLEDFADTHTDDAPPISRSAKTPAPKATPAKPATDPALDELLLAYCIQQKGDKNGPAFFASMYEKKSVAEKAEAVAALGLKAPQPEAKPADTPAPQPEAEVIEATPLGPDHSKLFDLIEALKEQKQSYDAINGKIAAICGGVYAVEELDDAQAAKAAASLSNWLNEIKAKGGK
jgi:hypothetical protein